MGPGIMGVCGYKWAFKVFFSEKKIRFNRLITIELLSEEYVQNNTVT